jgi:hypothetical protein
MLTKNFSRAQLLGDNRARPLDGKEKFLPSIKSVEAGDNTSPTLTQDFDHFMPRGKTANGLTIAALIAPRSIVDAAERRLLSVFKGR